MVVAAFAHLLSGVIRYLAIYVPTHNGFSFTLVMIGQILAAFTGP